VAEAVGILSQVASALDAAHQSSIVHRDLKPDNIFLCQVSGGTGDAVKVKLLDFGIAQMADGLHMRTGSNMVLGTPGYMSPEQCQGARIDNLSDIYALGVVAFEVLTGSLPFQGTNAFQVTAQHLTAQPPAPSERLPGLSKAIDAAVLRMLSKRPAERPPTASQAVAALSDGTSLPPPRSAAAVSSVTPEVTSRTKGLVVVTLLLALLGVGTALAARLVMSRTTAQAEQPPAQPHSEPLTVPSTAATPPLLPAAPAAPASVTLIVQGQPAAARVFRGKDELGALGQPISVPRSDASLTLSVRAPGFAARELPVVPLSDQTFDVKLVPSAKPRKPELEY
jgi:serine/threonine-protein kinase